MPDEGPQAGGRPAAVVSVTLADFPVYDGSVSPEPFIRQCRRLAELGGIPEEKLGGILAARCRGLLLRPTPAGGE